MPEHFPPDDALNALSGSQSAAGQPFPAIGDNPWYTSYYKDVYWVEQAARLSNNLRVYPCDTPGSFGIYPGSYRTANGSIQTYGGSDENSIVPSTTVVVYLDNTGSMQRAASYPSASDIYRLATITTDGGGAVTSITDDRVVATTDTFGTPSDISHKADKVAGAAAGNVAILDGTGNLVDSGVTLTSKANASTVSNHIAATTAHGTTGAIVGTSDVQTLTNKTFGDNLNMGGNEITHIGDNVTVGGHYFSLVKADYPYLGRIEFSSHNEGWLFGIGPVGGNDCITMTDQDGGTIYFQNPAFNGMSITSSSPERYFNYGDGTGWSLLFRTMNAGIPANALKLDNWGGTNFCGNIVAMNDGSGAGGNTLNMDGGNIIGCTDITVNSINSGTSGPITINAEGVSVGGYLTGVNNLTLSGGVITFPDNTAQSTAQLVGPQGPAGNDGMNGSNGADGSMVNLSQAISNGGGDAGGQNIYNLTNVYADGGMSPYATQAWVNANPNGYLTSLPQDLSTTGSPSFNGITVSASYITFSDSSIQSTAASPQNLSQVLGQGPCTYGNSIYMNITSGSGGGNINMEGGTLNMAAGGNMAGGTLNMDNGNIVNVGTLTVPLSAPGSPVAGMIYFDGTNFQGYDGTNWLQLNN